MNRGLMFVVLLLVAGSFQGSESLVAKKCYSPRAICVPPKFCASVMKIIESRSGNPAAKQSVWCRECESTAKSGVYCEPEDIVWEKSCHTMLKQKGKCLVEEQCDRGASFRKWNKAWRSGDLCFRNQNKEYFCCPEKMIMKSKTNEIRSPTTPVVENAYPACFDPNRIPGVCVPPRQCYHVYHNFLENKNNLNVKSFIKASQSKCTNGGTSICCAVNRGVELAWIRHPKARRLGLETCGSILMSDNIFDGQETELGAYPWMANLLYKDGRGKFAIRCGGTLIHRRYVMTAAHCGMQEKPVRVRLGEHDTSKRQDCVGRVCAKPHREYAIKRWIPHKKFRRNGAGSFDIALIELRVDAEIFSGQVAPICLPLTEQLLTLMPRDLIVTGWGETERTSKSDVLLETDVQIVDRSQGQCEAEGTFCARSKKNNVEGHCHGDSGGPYQTNVLLGDASYRFVQFGVISAGTLNCRDTGMGVSVGYHIDWILNEMQI